MINAAQTFHLTHLARNTSGDDHNLDTFERLIELVRGVADHLHTSTSEVALQERNGS
jgi:hypothetical protein